MIKNLILIALCAPLGWTAAVQVQKMLELNSAGLAIPDPDEQSKTALKAAKEQGDPLEVPESAVVVVVAVQDIDPEPGADAPAKGKATKPVSKLIETVQKHAKARSYARRLLNACADDDGARPEFGTGLGKPFGDEWHRVSDLLKEQRNIRGLLKKEDPGNKEILAALDKMGSKDPSFRKFIETQIEWKNCEKDASQDKFDQLYNALLDPGPPSDNLFELCGELQGTTKELDAFSEKHKDEPLCAEQVAEARLRSRAVELARLLKDANVKSDITHLFQKLDQLRKPEQPKFDEILRNTVQKLCDMLLPVENFDEFVLVQRDEGATEHVMRKDVTINPPGDEAVGIPLRLNEEKQGDEGKREYDEFHLPKREEIQSIGVGARNIPLPADKNLSPLEGTPYSKAIHAYNAARKQIKGGSKPWNAAALGDLKKVCDGAKHSKALKGTALLKRVEGVSKAIRDHHDLFPDGP